MKAELAPLLRCPAPDCSHADLALHAHLTKTLHYRTGPIEEVQEGELLCSACGRVYPISGYVPSFEQLFPLELKEEAAFWDKWYSFTWERGYLGFFDLKAPRAPFIAAGVETLDPSSLDRVELGGSHSMLADHPLVRDAGKVLDMGCGTGWSSLFLARRGHEVVGFDPSAANMRLAKRYAIAQGEYIEYLGAALGYLAFKPEIFDATVALHSIHHVPRLREEMVAVRSWLREGGTIAIDEHIRNNPVMMAIAAEMEAWAVTEVFPKARTLRDEDLVRLPQSATSSLEDAGIEEVIRSVLDNFVLEDFNSRYVTLDIFSFIYYLSRDGDVRAYHYSADVLNRFIKLFQAAYPEGAEYVTLIGRKSSRKVDEEAGESERERQALQLTSRDTANPESDNVGLTLLKTELRHLRHRLAQVTNQLEDASRNQRTLHEAASALRQDAGILNSVIVTLRGEVEMLNGTAATLRGEVEMLNEMASTLRGEVEMLNGTAATLRGEVEGLNRVVAAKDHHIVELEEWAHSLQRALHGKEQHTRNNPATSRLQRFRARVMRARRAWAIGRKRG